MNHRKLNWYRNEERVLQGNNIIDRFEANKAKSRERLTKIEFAGYLINVLERQRIVNRRIHRETDYASLSIKTYSFV